MCGVSARPAKDIILMGVKSVVLYDRGAVTTEDLAWQVGAVPVLLCFVWAV